MQKLVLRQASAEAATYDEDISEGTFHDCRAADSGQRICSMLCLQKQHMVADISHAIDTKPDDADYSSRQA